MEKNTPEIYEPRELMNIFASMTSLLFDQLPIPINFIDKDGRVIIMNEAFLQYLNLDLDDVKGKHLSDIDPSVRLPIVVKTGVAEIGEKHRFHNGKSSLVHRIPLFHQKEVIGGVGIILIEDLNFFYELKEHQDRENRVSYQHSRKAADIYRAKYSFEHILTQSPLKKQAKESAKKYAANNLPVLITGESGVGKELFAHAIHQSSTRSHRPFIRVNCGSIPDNLMESELFGYTKGSFTGANKEGKVGKFELANGGTIFLDEVGELPVHLQPKLLRVLQEEEFERVGSNDILKLDVKVIAATNVDLGEAVGENSFREDLYYRLNVLNLHVPNLRDTPEDIPLLVNHFSTLMYQQLGSLRLFSPEVMEIFRGHHWPGNIRELKNVVERMIVNSEDDTLGRGHVPDYLLKDHTKKNPPVQGDQSLREVLYQTEKRMILDTLEKCGGNKAKAAEKLGIPRMTLYRKLNAYYDK